MLCPNGLEGKYWQALMAWYQLHLLFYDVCKGEEAAATDADDAAEPVSKETHSGATYNDIYGSKRCILSFCIFQKFQII